jgi:outer membrane biosynthesis protein TonB
MTRSLITLPIRLGVRATKLVLKPYVAATKLALELIQEAGGQTTTAEPVPQPGVVVTPPPAPPPRAPAPPVAEPPPPPPPPPPPEPEPEPEPEPVEPAHVSEEPELVAEFAEPEAADGAGPEIEVQEPWDGYRRLKADEVVAAVADLSREELAVVELYEATHRKRRSVTSAVERRLKELSGPAARR